MAGTNVLSAILILTLWTATTGAYGILGTGNTNDSWEPPTSPIDLGDDFLVKLVHCAYGFCCGLSINQTMKCWGYNWLGRLGQGDTNNRGDEPGEMGNNLSEIDLGSDFEVIDFSCGGSHVCVLSSRKEIKCFGSNGYGALGIGNHENMGDDENEMGDYLPFVNLGTNFTAIQLTCGIMHSCALSSNFEVQCWGYNGYGQLGIGDSASARGWERNEMGDNLARIDLGTDFIVSAIQSGGYHICALSMSADVKCWGRNRDFGQLGLGDTIDRGGGEDPNSFTLNDGALGDYLPVVDLGTGFVTQSIGAAETHTFALSANGTLKAWGGNEKGQLGYGDVITRGDSGTEMADYLDGVDLGTGYNIVSVSSNIYGQHTCALLENGTDWLGLKCWGDNQYGQLGLGDTANRGDELYEMGDDLTFISVTFPALFTPTPTIGPTYNPTSNPTNNPTWEPTIKPTKSPTTRATMDPTSDPTASPTWEPTTKCEPYRNCTECLLLNYGVNVPQCFWHISEQKCYFFSEVDQDEDVIYDEDQCTTSNPESNEMFIWFGLAVVISLICFVTMTALIYLRRRNKLREESQKNMSNVLEMSSNPQNVDRDESEQIPSGDKEQAERMHSMSVLSRGEGMEADEGNNTVTIQDADV